jgi:hypothetical protein
MSGTTGRYEHAKGAGSPAPSAGVIVAFFADRTSGDEPYEGPLRNLVEDLHRNLRTREG